MESACVVRLVEAGSATRVAEWRSEDSAPRFTSPCAVCGGDHRSLLATMSEAQPVVRFRCPPHVENVWVGTMHNGAVASVIAVEIPIEDAAPEPRPAQLVRSVLPYINDHYDRALSLRARAKQAGVNSVYFSALFARVMGKSFKSYLTALRLQKAERLLADPVLRVSEVAYAVGYTDANRFRQAFKATHGLPPSEWRARHVAPYANS